MPGVLKPNNTGLYPERLVLGLLLLLEPKISHGHWLTFILLLQACGLPNVHMETHNSEDQNLFSPYRSKQHLRETGVLHNISKVHMRGKTVMKAQKQNKLYSVNLVEKKIPIDSAETAPCKCIGKQHTGQRCYNEEGAEGWARLGREFDLQLNTGAYS